jgi:hypothetical protein
MSPSTQEQLSVYFRSGDVIRSRDVSPVVLSAALNISELPTRLLADCNREVLRLGLEPGDVEALSIARARMRWPDYPQSVRAITDWMRTHNLLDALDTEDLAFMACRGARYHHDGDTYGGTAFCNLFVSDDKGLDLHFPHTGHRIPLARGTAVVFDTGQAHAVVPRHGDAFHPSEFGPERDCTQLFLTWELPIENANVAQALHIAFDIGTNMVLPPDEEHVQWNGEPAAVCPQTGQWRKASRSESTP